MKSRLTNQAPTAVVLAVTIAFTTVTALVAPAADNNKSAAQPATGLPIPQTIDPNTGLPLSPSPSWKDPNWKDPDKVLKEVTYDALPLGEVALQLRKEFHDAFDILIPNHWQHPNNPAVSLEPQNLSIRMQLKNVTASEVFNAMNLMFEGEN